ncbi:hypothetical protein [Arthrobacter agilis]|jgi:hypothetical protein|uniref:hypothetical protein n=1 Tax=Arthrobacter agilis TaxID=37921 RepID=UPI0027811B83|nr:hypothetical protein [Arthrobacter agilis]MDQ0736817.1 hypothetical protein [Arthrobacter agilis]
MTLLLILPVLIVLLAAYLVHVIHTDAPPITPASHGEWSADDLPSSAYSRQ